jgi:hypothetical protein
MDNYRMSGSREIISRQIHDIHSECDMENDAEGECENSQAKGSDRDDTSESAPEEHAPKGQPEAMITYFSQKGISQVLTEA